MHIHIYIYMGFGVYGLNSLKVYYIGDCIGTYYRGCEGGCWELRL